MPINSATTLVERSSSGGILGRYSVSLDLRLAVPAYASSGTYTGTMTVTLVEN
ncbi:MAG TPA: hypothetical protein PK765_07540 [bacterium]|nr:hypothetical protein [bacterium]